jgi:hypothetical protein
MANPTTNYGFVLPTPTDLVTDLPADFEVALQGVDTQMKTNADAATQKATLTTKGDIYAATGTSTPARLGVGTNGQLLVADSTTATGLAWATAGSSIPANSAATVATAQTTSSATYTDLATAGPAVTVTTGTKALVIVSSAMRDTGGTNNVAYMSYAVSGATTVAATDASAIAFVSTNINAGNVFRFSAASVVTLTAGSNTFTAKYRTSNVTDYSNRAIFVMNLA